MYSLATEVVFHLENPAFRLSASQGKSLFTEKKPPLPQIHKHLFY